VTQEPHKGLLRTLNVYAGLSRTVRSGLDGRKHPPVFANTRGAPGHEPL
jgi:hypothetical protein